MREDIARIAYPEATRLPQRHHTRHIPGRCLQTDVCVSGLVCGATQTLPFVPVSRAFFDGMSDMASDHHHHQRSQTSVTYVADDRLFSCIINDCRHLLRPLLPPTRDEHYTLCKLNHNPQLSAKTSSLRNNGCGKRILYEHPCGAPAIHITAAR